MTPADLEKLVATGDLDGIAAATESLTEADRKKLAPTAEALFKLANKTRRGAMDRTDEESALQARLKSYGKWKPEDYRQASWPATELAVVATCGWTAVRRLELLPYQHSNGPLLRILLGRRPDWVEKWIEDRVKKEAFLVDWAVVRTPIREELCPKPAEDGYIRVMAVNLPGWTRARSVLVPLSQKLLDDPQLLEDEIWRLFQVETDAFAPWTEEHQVRAGQGYESWTTALRKLADLGHIDRQRLLDASLSGLLNRFKNDALTGYIYFYEQMQPTDDERLARQRAYLDLLSHPAGHVLTFALNELKAVAKTGKLDAKEFLASARPALTGRTKAQPKAAMAILDLVAKRDASLRSAVARLLVEALVHDSPDVQGAAVKLLEKYADGSDAALGRLVAERLDGVAATERPHVEALLQRFGELGAVPEPETSSGEDHDDLMRRARALPAELRRTCGVDDALAACEGQALPPLRFEVYDAAVLTGVEPLTPIADVEELIDAVSRAVETIDTADEVERIWDGISRLCAERPSDFERRTDPLVKRVNDIACGRGMQGIQSIVAPTVSLAAAALVLAWLRPNLRCPEEPAYALELYYPERFLNTRLSEITQRVSRRDADPMLAAPTHTGGWIDPRVFVERLKRVGTTDTAKHRFDLLQALLRLAPDNRAQALADAQSLKGEVGRIVRWALGAPEGPPKASSQGNLLSRVVARATPKVSAGLGGIVRSSQEHASLWLAAGRARNLRGRLEELSQWRLEHIGPDGIEPAVYLWRGLPKPGTSGRSSRRLYTAVSQQPEKRELAAPEEWPTAALHDWDRYSFYMSLSTGWFIDWIGSIWPQNSDSFFANGIQSLILRLDSNASTWSPNCVFLRGLLPSDRPWSKVAHWFVLTALAGRDADVRSHAVDALIEAVGDGRAHPEQLGEALALLTRDPQVKLNRIVGGLTEVSRVSEAHAWVVAETLAVWLAAQDELPRDAHHALEPLLELATRCGMPLPEKARACLGTAQGSSKTAKLAKRLLDLESTGWEAKRRLLVLDLLKGRLERAERWKRSE